MSSPSGYQRLDHTKVTSPLHTVDSKEPQNPFRVRRLQQRTPQALSSSREHASTQLSRPAVLSSDATSTSSSTLVNIDPNTDYHPWEVRSDSSSSSHNNRAAYNPPMPVLGQALTPSYGSSLSHGAGTSSPAASRRRAPSKLNGTSSKRKLCPDDCRCSDQDLAVGVCRRAIESSGSSSESSSLSVRVYETRQARATATDQGMSASDNDLSLSRLSGRNFRKDPVMVPRELPSRRSRSSTSTLYTSFDQLQRGLGLPVSQQQDSDAESDAEHSSDRRPRTELSARWRSRRDSSFDTGRNISTPAEPTARFQNSPRRRPWVSTPITAAASQSAYQTPESQDDSKSPFMSAGSGRRSIAAVFESLQKERESRAADEQRRWKEKQGERERQREARALRTQTTHRPSESPSASLGAGLVHFSPRLPIKTPAFTHTTAKSASPTASPHLGSTTSLSGRSTPSATPVLSSTFSPTMDEPIAEDVLSRHLQEEAAPRIPNTVSEGSEEEENSDHNHDRESTSSAPVDTVTEQHLDDHFLKAGANSVKQEEGDASILAAKAESTAPAATSLATPQSSQAFGFSSQPMALDLSPTGSGAGTVSNLSSPATSPRKAAHRRQTSAATSVAAHLPPASVKVAQSRLNQALQRSSDQPVDITPLKYAATNAAAAYPQTPGILSSARKGLQGDYSMKSRHNVRFSPRLDYRSDSGSWDESEVQLDPHSEQPAGTSEILIPEILADASAELDVSTKGTTDTQPKIEVEKEVQHSLQQSASPVRPGTEHGVDAGNGSISRSMHVPGTYLPSPAKLAAPFSGSSPVSRHVIRPSPTSVRTKVLTFPSTTRQQVSAAQADDPDDSGLSHTSSAGTPEHSPSRNRLANATHGATRSGEYGLFPETQVPRTSTPPPTTAKTSTGEARRTPSPDRGFGRNDPRNSPRSPRPPSMKARDEFQPFETAPSDQGDGSVSQLVRTILSTLDTSRKTRMQQDFSTAVGNVNDQIESVLQTQRGVAVIKRTEHFERTRALSSPTRTDQIDGDDAAVQQLRQELTDALTVLADRVQSSGAGDGQLSNWSRRRPKWVLAVVLGAQCALMALLLHVAESRAQRMRMYAGAEYAISYAELYHPVSSTVDWSSAATETHLTPLLNLPFWSRLADRFPPLPSSASIALSNLSSTPSHATHQPPTGLTSWSVYTAYISTHGWSTFFVQLTIYTLAQLTSFSLLLLLAPLQILYYLLVPP